MTNESRVPLLADEEFERLLDIDASRARFTGADVDDEIIATWDGSEPPLDCGRTEGCGPRRGVRT